MENQLKRIAFIPDCHAPYHNKKALSLTLKVLQDFSPDILVCLGDLCDFYSISKFSKSAARQMDIHTEILAANEILDDLDLLSASQKIFIEGNHEYRWIKYLRDKAPQVEFLPDFATVDIPRLYKLESRGWSYTPYKDSYHLGKLWITHDVGTVGRYSVFRAADTFQSPIVMAHTHRLVYVVEGNALGEHFPAIQFGWLGDASKVDYAHKALVNRFWSLGFGIGYMGIKGEVHLQAVPIIELDGRLSCVVEGKEYSI